MVSKKSRERSKKTKEKQKNILEMLKSHGAKIYDDLDNGQFPKFSIPSRSVSNIVYDKKLRQYILETILHFVAKTPLNYVHLHNL